MCIDGAHPMVAVGEMSQQFGQINLGGSTFSNITSIQPYKATKFTGVQIPQIKSHSTLPFPALKSKVLVNPGYQEAHDQYNDMRAHFAGKAFSNVANAEMIVVKVWMMVRVPNRKSPAPVSVYLLFLLCNLIFTVNLLRISSKLFQTFRSILVLTTSNGCSTTHSSLSLSSGRRVSLSTQMNVKFETNNGLSSSPSIQMLTQSQKFFLLLRVRTRRRSSPQNREWKPIW